MTPIISDPSDTKGWANAFQAPSLSPFGPSLFHVSALRASINFRNVAIADQERRWSHLIEFAESSRRARAAEKAAGENR